MTSHAVVIVSDAHIGFAPASCAEAFHRFLDTMPELGEHLVINGDLFEFWFEYHSVIPRRAFPTLEALASLRRRGVRLTLTGGNHDRWGGSFWREALDAEFHPHGVELELAGFKCLVAHGDGVAESLPSARVLHAVTRHPITSTLFRLLHPDLGMAMVRGMSPFLAGKARDPETMRRAADRQATYAQEMLRRRTDLHLVVLGHTHEPRLLESEPRRWYLNPGAWAAGLRYATLTRDGPALAQFPS